MPIYIPLIFCFVTVTLVDDDPAVMLFREAEQLSRERHPTEAMEKIKQAIAELERQHAADERISWQGMNGLRFAARLAREDLLDYDQAFAFCDKLFELADSDYWEVPARLERALTYRAKGDFAGAQQEYDAIATSDERQRIAALLPRAEMIYFEMKNLDEGKRLLRQAVANEHINARERVSAVRRCAERAMENGRRKEALEWLDLVERIPIAKLQDRARFLSQVWYEMGNIQESLGKPNVAKSFYKKAMELKDGEMRFRTRARDALENIEYFE
jgi:tetratricopeptide (TPR) repeat protein